MITRKLYRWSIDRINGRFITGWCFNRLLKTRPVTIVAAADDTVLGEFVNDGYRPDLVELKLHPNGVCAFDFSFPADFDPGQFTTFYLYFDSLKTPVAAIDCTDIEVLRPRNQQPVWFMHIPKTAGTSFNTFTRHCYPGSRFKTHLERYDKGLRAREVEGAAYCAGHLPLYELLDLPVSSFSLYSIIREPYAHVHSHLNYVRLVKPGMSVEQHYAFRHNETVKNLSDALNRIDFSDPGEVGTFVDGLSGFERDFFDNMQTRYFLDYRPDRVGKEDLARATENIHRFRSVGLTEDYDAFRDRFCDELGLPRQRQEMQSNKAPSYRLFDLRDSRIREALHPLVAYDLELYEYAAEHFRQQR